MKNTHNKALAILASCALLAAGPLTASGQTAPQIIGVYATPEKAVQIHWTSNPREIFEIDYATSLIDTNTGATTWHKLYDNYPAHGTNTFWLDTGDYYVTPTVNHPKFDATRFYRVVLTGTDTADVEPTIAITSPSDGATVSGTITVSVSVQHPNILSAVKLYVDGQEMQPREADGNFTLNTCEWWNGRHVLFATAETVSHYAGIPNDTSVTRGHGVSQRVNLTFSNLISEVAYSQQFFEPALGQTQRVTARFTANCDWTLQVLDVHRNAVRHASGSGGFLLFDWDGTGDGGVNIPNGRYTYSISAQPNGLPLPNASAGSVSPVVSPLPMKAMSSPAVEATRLYVADGNGAVPLALFPPGMDTSGLTFFEAAPSEIQASRPTLATAATPSSLMAASAGLSGGLVSKDAGGSGDSASPQAQEGPKRPPPAPIKGTQGTFYVGYNTYGPNGYSAKPIPTGWPWPYVKPQYVQIDGQSAAEAKNNEPLGSILEYTQLANDFVKTMQSAGWKGVANPKITEVDVPSGIFNYYNVGLLCVHASCGMTPEKDGVTRSYLRFYDEQNQSESYCRLDDCRFGSGATNGLKWMAILGCNVLNDIPYNSLRQYGRLPMNNDLHLLLSTATTATAAPTIGKFWAENMFGLGTNSVHPVADAWFIAGDHAYHGYGGTEAETNHVTIIFRVAYWPDALNDYITDVNGSPGTGSQLDINKKDVTVYSNP